MPKNDSWPVAAAILLRENCSLNIKTLTEMVRRTELTKLGLKGSTPVATLRTILATQKVNGRPIFSRTGSGEYAVSDRDFVQELPLVRKAIEDLDKSPTYYANPNASTARFIQLQDEVNRLRARNKILETKLKQITEICQGMKNTE
jgi:hypothetical protein